MAKWYVGTSGPKITGTKAGQTTSSNSAIDPFSDVTIVDPNAGATDILTITLSGSGGMLTDGSGFSGLQSLGNGVYTLTGSDSAITAELDALVFTPVTGAPDTLSTTSFSLSDASSGYGSTTYDSSATQLFSFLGNSHNGENPVGGLVSDAAGNLYGVAQYGGANGDGSVYELVKSGTSYTLTTIYSFGGVSDGSKPVSTLISDAAGNLFGTTMAGGSDGYGTVFELVNTGSGYTLSTLANFNGTNGSTPVAGLVADANGNLFGTTRDGGVDGAGTVFEIVNNGTAAAPSYASAPTVLYNFTGSADGANPAASLIIDGQGNLLGTVENAGGGAYPDGGVFELAKSGMSYTFSTIAQFDGTGGANPGHGPVANLVADAAGNLFGTTEYGGSPGYGTVFEIKNYGTVAVPDYSSTATTLYEFTGGADGAEPLSGLLIDAKGDLFGTTSLHGANGVGTAFELVWNGSGYTFETIVAFNDAAGNSSYSTLLADGSGHLFGTLSYGSNAAGGGGSVFEIGGQFASVPTVDSTTTVTNDTYCFMAGTNIRTPGGEAPVESLKRGDLVTTLDGETRPVAWVGRQSIASRFAERIRSWPIRVRAGALGENVPCRDLLVSPDHALLVDGVLIHAGALVNGSSITRETAPPDHFIYYHVELDDHSLIFAEAAPAETFIDNVDRFNFDNWAEHEALYPEGKALQEMTYPRAKARRQVPASIRAALDERAEAIGVTATAAA